MYTSNHYVKISVTFIYFTKTVNFIMVVHVCWLYICITCVLIVYVCCTFVLHGCWLYMCVECTCVLDVHVCQLYMYYKNMQLIVHLCRLNICVHCRCAFIEHVWWLYMLVGCSLMLVVLVCQLYMCITRVKVVHTCSV